MVLIVQSAAAAAVLLASVHTAAAVVGNAFPAPNPHAFSVLFPRVSAAHAPQSADEGIPLLQTHRHLVTSALPTLFVGCILYADDIVLLSPSCFGLQKLLNICEQFASN